VLIYRLLPMTAWQTAGAAAVRRQAASAWATANLSVSAAVATVGLLKTAFMGLGAFLVGWEIGTWLSEKFEIVRKAGIFMVEVLVEGGRAAALPLGSVRRHLHLGHDCRSAKRHEARLAEMNQIFAQMYADAPRGEAAKGAMNTAGDHRRGNRQAARSRAPGTRRPSVAASRPSITALEKLKSRLARSSRLSARPIRRSTTPPPRWPRPTRATSIVEANLLRQIEAVARYQQEQSALETPSPVRSGADHQVDAVACDALTQQTTLRRQRRPTRSSSSTMSQGADRCGPS
jgi:hypothetical protein